MPRATLDGRLSRLSTFKVLLTKHTEEDLWNHFINNTEKYKQYYWETEATLSRALDDVRQSNPYTSRDAWRKFQRDCRKIPLRYEHTWWYYARTEDDESKSDLHFWFMRFVKDIEVCDLVFGWSNSKEEYNNLHYDLDRMRSDILQMEQEIVQLDKEMYDTAYNTWKIEDAEWIRESNMRRNHADHKPRWEHQQRCLRDPEEKAWYDRLNGGEPFHLKQCPLCLASPNHQRTLEEKKKLEEEEAEQERQDEERRKEADRIAREEERQKRLAEYKARPPPTRFHCEACDVVVTGENSWDIHLNSREHQTSQRHKDWYCEKCKVQARSDVEYRHHITTRKHLGETEQTTREPEALTCEPCGYSCYLKQHLDQHCKSKKHIAKMSQNK